MEKFEKLKKQLKEKYWDLIENKIDSISFYDYVMEHINKIRYDRKIDFYEFMEWIDELKENGIICLD